MTNEQMKPGRFLRWHKARRRVAFIRNNLNSGRTIYIATATRILKVTSKNIDMFKATKSGAYIQRGKSWDCIDFCKITAA